jgi:hypothetical protein
LKSEIRTKYDYTERRPERVGFTVSNRVIARIRDTKLGDVSSTVVLNETFRSPRGSSMRSRVSAIILTTVLIPAACGNTDNGADNPATTAVSTISPTSTTSSEPSTTIEIDVTTTPPLTTTSRVTTTPVVTTAGPSTTTNPVLPGEEIDIGPRAGDVIAVVGVEHDDVVKVRSAPGDEQPIVTTAPPTAEGILALGHTRLLTQSLWFEVNVDGTTGWAPASQFAYLGRVDDATSEVVAKLGSTPVAPTLTEMARSVAAVFASTEPVSRIAISVAETEGDLGEITVDVVGIGDDSLAGSRLHIFAVKDGGDWSLKSVEHTLLCTRGLSGEICV